MPNWRTYTATIRFNDRLIGGIPIVDEHGRPDAYRGWLKGQDVQNDQSFPQPLAVALAEDTDMPVSAEGGELTGFKRDDLGVYIEARQVKAMLKEAAQRLGYVKQIRGSRQVLQHDLHVRSLDGSQKLHVGRMEPDGIDTRPIAVITPQGPRTSIKGFEFVAEAELSFSVKLLAGGIGDGLIGEVELRNMLELGQDLGLGADRSQGEGTFVLLSLERNG